MFSRGGSTILGCDVGGVEPELATIPPAFHSPRGTDGSVFVSATCSCFLRATRSEIDEPTHLTAYDS